eukprot:scaffold70093_cov31-Tisochrysis_lutea.AAC.4
MIGLPGATLRACAAQCRQLVSDARDLLLRFRAHPQSILTIRSRPGLHGALVEFGRARILAEAHVYVCGPQQRFGEGRILMKGSAARVEGLVHSAKLRKRSCAIGVVGGSTRAYSQGEHPAHQAHADRRPRRRHSSSPRTHRCLGLSGGRQPSMRVQRLPPRPCNSDRTTPQPPRRCRPLRAWQILSTEMWLDAQTPVDARTASLARRDWHSPDPRRRARLLESLEAAPRSSSVEWKEAAKGASPAAGYAGTGGSTVAAAVGTSGMLPLNAAPDAMEGAASNGLRQKLPGTSEPGLNAQSHEGCASDDAAACAAAASSVGLDIGCGKSADAEALLASRTVCSYLAILAEVTISGSSTSEDQWR